MILAVDVGNSNIKTGLWDGDQWSHQNRVDTYPLRQQNEYQSQLQSVLNETGIEADEINQAIIGSVVPAVTAPFEQAMKHVLGRSPKVLSADMDTGITISTKKPVNVGADLIAGAAGAYDLVRDTCLFLDFGTATTVMAVTKPGELKGGAICGGLKASVNALVGDTAQLPEIPLEIPSSSVGKNTVECMQSGLVGGHLAMAEGLVDQMREELGAAKVIATGGLVSVLAPHATCFDYVKPTLVLDGLRLIAERQRANGKGET